MERSNGWGKFKEIPRKRPIMAEFGKDVIAAAAFVLQKVFKNALGAIFVPGIIINFVSCRFWAEQAGFAPASVSYMFWLFVCAVVIVTGFIMLVEYFVIVSDDSRKELLWSLALFYTAASWIMAAVSPAFAARLVSGMLDANLYLEGEFACNASGTLCVLGIFMYLIFLAVLIPLSILLSYGVLRLDTLRHLPTTLAELEEAGVQDRLTFCCYVDYMCHGFGKFRYAHMNLKKGGRYMDNLESLYNMLPADSETRGFWDVMWEMEFTSAESKTKVLQAALKQA